MNCSVNGCNRSASWADGGRNGWCNMHSIRARRHGDPTTVLRRRNGPEIERFRAFLVITPPCVLWSGAHTPEGYATFSIRGGQTVMAHRWSYEYYVGPIPEGLTLDHLCRNRGCVLPWHLEPVTHAENILRGVSPTAVNARKTHCHRDHPLYGDNLRITPTGARVCRECRRIYGRERYWAAR